jgi:hypothetical protein
MNQHLRGIGTAILASLFFLGGSLQAAGSSQRFADECSECHGDAKEFVLEWLEFSDGSLMAMGVEMPVAEFLEKHQGLTPEDIDYYVDLLTRVANDAGLK